MQNLPATIYSYLSNPAYWIETNPAVASVVFRYDEYDPKSPALQICLENLPDNKIWVAPDLQRVEHSVRLTLFLKPVRYDATTIEANKTTFLNAKTQIDKILTHYKFDMTNIRNIIQSGWDDRETVRRGYGTKGEKGKEPIQFRSILIITGFYYETSDDTPISIIRAKRILIGKDVNNTYEWIDNFSIRWSDKDPWVHIFIPKGTQTIHQHVLSPHFEGSFGIKDLAKLQIALFQTAIDALGHYAVDPTTYTKRTIGYFKVDIIKSDGNVQSVLFTGVRIASIEVDTIRVGTDTTFTVRFTADLVTYV